MKKWVRFVGKTVSGLLRHLGVGILQFSYNTVYITGAQTLRILKRLETRVERFLYPLRDVCHRIYVRFFRRKVRVIRYSRVRIWSNLRWESGHLKMVRKEQGVRRALGHLRHAHQHRAILFAAGQVVIPLAALLILAGTIWFWSQQNYGLYLSYGDGQTAVVEDEGVFEQAAEMMNQRMLFDSSAQVEVNTVASYQLGIVGGEQF